jgi:hypothetical protein
MDDADTAKAAAADRLEKETAAAVQEQQRLAKETADRLDKNTKALKEQQKLVEFEKNKLLIEQQQQQQLLQQQQQQLLLQQQQQQQQQQQYQQSIPHVSTRNRQQQYIDPRQIQLQMQYPQYQQQYQQYPQQLQYPPQQLQYQQQLQYPQQQLSPNINNYRCTDSFRYTDNGFDFAGIIFDKDIIKKTAKKMIKYKKSMENYKTKKLGFFTDRTCTSYSLDTEQKQTCAKRATKRNNYLAKALIRVSKNIKEKHMVILTPKLDEAINDLCKYRVLSPSQTETTKRAKTLACYIMILLQISSSPYCKKPQITSQTKTTAISNNLENNVRKFITDFCGLFPQNFTAANNFINSIIYNYHEEQTHKFIQEFKEKKNEQIISALKAAIAPFGECEEYPIT